MADLKKPAVNGYFPAKEAIDEGSYAVEIRNCDETEEEIIIVNSLDISDNLAKQGHG